MNGLLHANKDIDEEIHYTRKRMNRASGNVPFGTSGDNDFLLDVFGTSDSNLGYQIAMDLQSNSMKFRRKVFVWDKWKTILTDDSIPVFQIFIFNPNGSTDIELTLAHNAQTHTVYASNGDIDAYTGFVIGTQLVNNTNKLRILLSKQHWGNIRIQVMYMKS